MNTQNSNGIITNLFSLLSESHNTRTTQWEDPRKSLARHQALTQHQSAESLHIRSQQQRQQQQQQQQVAAAAAAQQQQQQQAQQKQTQQQSTIQNGKPEPIHRQHASATNNKSIQKSKSHYSIGTFACIR